MDREVMGRDARDMEDTIDLEKLFKIIVKRIKLVAAIILGCTLVALVVAFALPKGYESTTTVQVRSVSKAMGGNVNNLSSYVELIKSRAVLDAAGEKLSGDAEGAAVKKVSSSSLDVKNVKNTNLISVTAKGGTPAEAQQISQAVVDGFLAQVASLSDGALSPSVKLLAARMEKAQAGAEEAQNSLEAYGSQHGAVGQAAQVASLLQATEAYDKEIGSLTADALISDAEVFDASAKLQEQEPSSRAHNFAENGRLTALRQQLTDKKLALARAKVQSGDQLVLMQQLRQDAAGLENAIDSEAGALAVIQGGMADPVQVLALQKQIAAIVEGKAVDAALAALQEDRLNVQKGFGALSAEATDYVQLASEARVKENTCQALADQVEEKRTKESIISGMDVQIVDKANLPETPSSPRKGLITAIGFCVGIMIVFGYSLIIYKKEN